MLNLINLLDPGPLFPLGELRQAVLGDPQHKITRFVTSGECKVYENLNDKPPFDINHATFGELPKNSKVRIRNGEVYERWTKVVVKTTTAHCLNNKEGWIRSDSIKPDEQGRTLTKVSQPLFVVIPAVQPRFPPVTLRTLPQGKLLRKLDDRNEKWVLVAPVLEEVKVVENGLSHFELMVSQDMQKHKFNEGWIEMKDLENA